MWAFSPIEHLVFHVVNRDMPFNVETRCVKGNNDGDNGDDDDDIYSATRAQLPLGGSVHLKAFVGSPQHRFWCCLVPRRVQEMVHLLRQMLHMMVSCDRRDLQNNNLVGAATPIVPTAAMHVAVHSDHKWA